MKRSLSKKELLRKKKEIKNLFYSSSQYSCKGMKLFVLAASDPLNRILITTTRGYGTAVERNYIRRIGKEIFRSNKNQLHNGFDLAFLFYPGEYSYADRSEQMFILLDRAHLINKNDQYS